MGQQKQMNKVFKAKKISDEIFTRISDWEVVLSVYHDRPDEWKERNLEDLTSICDYIIFQMQNAKDFVKYMPLQGQNMWREKLEMLLKFTKINTEKIRKHNDRING